MQRLSESEYLVMRKIWEAGHPVTAGELVAAFCESRGWKIQTVSTFLSRLVEKGMLLCRKQGGQNHFTALVTQAQYRAAETRSFLKEMHGGSVQSLLTTLYDDQGLSGDDISELKQWLAGR